MAAHNILPKRISVLDRHGRRTDAKGNPQAIPLPTYVATLVPCVQYGKVDFSTIAFHYGRVVGAFTHAIIYARQNVLNG